MWGCSYSTMQKTPECPFPNTTLLSGFISIPMSGQVPPLKKGGLRFFLKDKWDFCLATNEGKEYYFRLCREGTCGRFANFIAVYRGAQLTTSVAALSHLEWNRNSTRGLLAPPYSPIHFSSFATLPGKCVPKPFSLYQSAEVLRKKSRKIFSFHKFPQEPNYYFFQLWNNHAASRKGSSEALRK